MTDQVSKMLPPLAREMLQAAARTPNGPQGIERRLAIERASMKIRMMYPQFFQGGQDEKTDIV